MSLSGGSGTTINNTVENVQATLGSGTSIACGNFIAGTTTLNGTGLTNSTGTLNLGATNLTHVGTVASGSITVASGDITAGNTVLSTTGLTNTTGAIDFDNDNLTTMGTVASGSHTVGNTVLSTTGLTNTTGVISFGDDKLTTTGTVVVGTTTLSTTGLTNTTGAISLATGNKLTKENDIDFYEYTQQNYPMFASVNTASIRYMPFFSTGESNAPGNGHNLLLCQTTQAIELVYTSTTALIGNLTVWKWNADTNPTTTTGTVVASVNINNGTAFQLYSLSLASFTGGFPVASRIAVSIEQPNSTTQRWQMNLVLRHQKDIV